MTDRCSTCGEPYEYPPTGRAMFCSNGFHCCRDCKWRDGVVVDECDRCAGYDHTRAARRSIGDVA